MTTDTFLQPTADVTHGGTMARSRTPSGKFSSRRFLSPESSPPVVPSALEFLPQRLARLVKRLVVFVGSRVRSNTHYFDLASHYLHLFLSLCVFAPLSALLSRFPTPVTDWLENVAITHRGILVCLFLLPVSGLYELYRKAVALYNEEFAPAPAKDHLERVKNVQRQVRAARAQGKMMCTARPGWKSMSLCEGQYKKTLANIELNLSSVIGLDVERRVVKVEPLVTAGQISRYLIQRGWTLPVLPELDDLTVGGLIMGFGVETSSHKYGLFQHICLAFEIVLPSGELVRCSHEERPELFAAIPWSHGTIGFLVAAEIMIIPAKKYVKLAYTPFTTKKSYVDAFIAAARPNAGNDFVETLVYSEDTAVLMTGDFVDEDQMLEETKSGNGGVVNRINQSNKEWFYLHVKSYLNKGATGIEYIPLREYYHRHTRSIFWELKDIIPFGDQAWCRNLLGGLMPPNIALMKLTQTESLRQLYEKHHVVQDMLVPIETLSDSISVFHEEFNIYPLWLCPMLLPAKGPGAGADISGLVHPHGGMDGRVTNDALYVDIGAYGTPDIRNFDHAASLRRVEKYVRSVHGFQAMYADTRMTKDEFREMFDHTLYNVVREEVGALDAFPDVYDKVSRAARRAD